MSTLDIQQIILTAAAVIPAAVFAMLMLKPVRRRTKRNGGRFSLN